MNPISQNEYASIEQARITNDNLETFFDGKIQKWDDEIQPLFATLKSDFTLHNAPKIVEVESLALSYRQIINSEINLFMSQRTKETVILKNIKQEKYLFYTNSFAIKTNLTEKAILIDAHTTEIMRKIELIEAYIEFLRSTSKNMESLGYAIKAIIELHNYLGNK